MWNSLRENLNTLNHLTKQYREEGIAAAEADREYRMKVAVAVLHGKELGYPATLIKDAIYKDEALARARFERDCAQANYEATKEAINTLKLETRIVNDQLNREWNQSGQRDY